MSLTGVFKITLLNLTLNSEDLEEKNVVELTIGSTKTQARTKTKNVDFGRDIHILKFENGEKLEIIVGEKVTSKKVAYSCFNLQKLASEPGVIHHVKVNLYLREKEKVTEQQVGVLNIDMKYAKHITKSSLDIMVNRAVLIRDTQVVGKMDPFVRITLGDNTKQTTVKDGVGKQPVWDELYSVSVVNELEKLVLTVLDEDVTTDDVVGSIQLVLADSGILSSGDWKDHTLEIMYEGKKAGDLYIRTRYTKV